MSRIVSPLPPIRINITLDERTGLAQMQCSKDLEFHVVAQTFAALMIQVIENRLKQHPVAFNGTEQLPFEVAMLSMCKLMLGVIQGKNLAEMAANNPDRFKDNPFGNPAGKPEEKPAGNSGGD